MANIVGINNLVFYLLTLWASFCYGQQRVYRADTRSPEEMQRVGSFLPRGTGTGLRQVAPNISMYNHAIGAANFQSSADDGYVSTAADEPTAINFLGNFFGGTGYIYTIAATPNFIQVAGTLGRFNPFSDELEYAALGGFSWDQVEGWARYDQGTQVGAFATNPSFNSARYATTRANAGEPSLAGFPNGHAAWREAPWNAFANGNCGPSGRKLRLRQTNCGSASTAVQLAVAYMDKACAGGACS